MVVIRKVIHIEIPNLSDFEDYPPYFSILNPGLCRTHLSNPCTQVAF